MNINFDGVIWLVVFVIGVYFFVVGLKAKKFEEKRQAGILSIIMSICAFAALGLAILVYALKPARSWVHIVSTIQLVIGGVWVGVYVAMLALERFGPCPPPSKNLKEVRKDKTRINDKASPKP